MARTLNRRRLALSVAVVGAVALPIWTGALKRAYRQPSETCVTLVKDNREEFMRSKGMSYLTCFIPFHHNIVEQQACQLADAIDNVVTEEPCHPNLQLLASKS